MSFFQPLEGEAAVIVSGGIWKQVELFRRGNALFVKIGQGFARVMADGSTSKHKTRLDCLSYDGPLWRSPLGHLLVGAEDGAKPIDQDKRIQLAAPRMEAA